MKRSIHSTRCTHSIFTPLWHCLSQSWFFLLRCSGHDEAQVSSAYRLLHAHRPDVNGINELINRHWLGELYRAQPEFGVQYGFSRNANGGVYGFVAVVRTRVPGD